MLLGRLAVFAPAICAGLMLAACVADSPAPDTAVLPVAAVATPASDWQWSDTPAGPAVTLETTDVAPASGPRMASLALTCSDATPSIAVSWDAPVAAAGLAYRFDGQPGHDVSAEVRDPQSEIVADPLVVSRFIDEAAVSRQLVVSAGATRATFATTDDAGNLRRFRTVCPSGTN
jgi:hypothetical protein